MRRRWWLPRSLRGRLLLGSALSLVVMLVLAQLILSRLFEQHVTRRIEMELEKQANLLTSRLDNAYAGRHGGAVLAALDADMASRVPDYQQPLSGYYWQVSMPDGELRSRSLWDGRLYTGFVPADGHLAFAVLTGPGGKALLAGGRRVVRRLYRGDVYAVTEAVLLVTAPASQIIEARQAFSRDIGGYLAAMGGLLLLVAVIQIQIAAMPLSRLRRAIAEIRAGRLRRLPDTGPSELISLVREMNALLEALDQSVERARTRAADLAHGLKTPLAVIRGELEQLRQDGVVSDDQATGIDHAVDRLDANVRRELARARVRGGGSGALPNLSIRPVVERVVNLVSRLPAAETIRISIQIDPEMTLAVDADDLTEMLGNLLENAVRYARQEIVVRCDDRHDKAGNRGVLSVIDDGAGVSADDLAAIRRRGQRLDEQGGGSGLGLAIVQDIMEAYGGFLELNSPAGQGLQARLIFLSPPDEGVI